MRPRSFEYYAPSTVLEAVSLLDVEGSKVLAGGQSLVTLMKLRLVSPSTLIDLNGIRELTEINETDGFLQIGALVRHDQLANNQTVRKRAHMLAEAADQIADQQVRNRGTIGGSLAHADPAADLPTACLALKATIVAENSKGSRSISSDEFFKDFFSTALNENEIIREVRVPIHAHNSAGAYQKLTRGHNDFAVVSVAGQVTVNEQSVCEDSRVVLGGVASTPIRALKTEQHLIGEKIQDRLLDEASEKAIDGLSPPSDIRATSEQRLRMVKVLTRRTLRTATTRAMGAGSS